MTAQRSPAPASPPPSTDAPYTPTTGRPELQGAARPKITWRNILLQLNTQLDAVFDAVRNTTNVAVHAYQRSVDEREFRTREFAGRDEQQTKLTNEIIGSLNSAHNGISALFDRLAYYEATVPQLKTARKSYDLAVKRKIEKAKADAAAADQAAAIASTQATADQAAAQTGPVLVRDDVPDDALPDDIDGDPSGDESTAAAE